MADFNPKRTFRTRSYRSNRFSNYEMRRFYGQNRRPSINPVKLITVPLRVLFSLGKRCLGWLGEQMAWPIWRRSL